MAQIILDSNNNLIQGDFDNATLNNRTKLQTTTTNATSNVYVVPNGSATSAGVSVANNSNLTNASKIVMATNGTTDTQIISGVNGSGTYLPLSFYTNNALVGQFTTAGNLTLTGGLTVGANAAPAFSAYSNVNQSLSAATQTKVIFQVEEFDTNSNFASSRFTPTVAGYYQINGATTMSGSGVSRLFTSIFKNGVEFKRGNDLLVSGYQANVASLIYLNGTTDYIELYCWINGSSALTTSASQWEVYLNGCMVRSA